MLSGWEARRGYADALPRNARFTVGYGANDATDCAIGFEAVLVQLIVVAPAVAIDLMLPPPELLLVPSLVSCDHSFVCPLPAVTELCEAPKPKTSTIIAPFVFVVIEVEIELVLLFTASVATASGAPCATFDIVIAPAIASVTAALNVTATV
jgi:hypothetical protein